MQGKLPIEVVLPELQEKLRAGLNAVLVAQPGAGKTTRVPLALLEEPWLAGKRVLMLEPRRLAARAAARYMAAQLGEQVGETVGYRVRMDTRVGVSTRIEVITEAVLTRLLQDDPALEGVGVVIFDEFHERNLHSDIGLALCLQTQSLLREDLRLLVMSATLDAEPIASLLNNAPIVTSEGRAYPVETIYASSPIVGKVEPAVVRAVQAAMAAHEGDVLVFLPGAGEIRRVAERLAALRLGAGVLIAPLYGNLRQEEQEQALAPAPSGSRKVVLATAIAETSLTVEGVRLVVDGGLMRVPRFSPRTGMTRLETVPVSAASADQRRGRAGRVAPGVCYRLWTAEAHRQLAKKGTPEIVEADLASLTLELAAWGVTDPAELQWLDVPPAAAIAQARGLLRALGALDAGGRMTPHGKRMAALGVHPRLAHMMLCALPLGLVDLACELAALLGERDILRGSPGGSAGGASLGGLGGSQGAGAASSYGGGQASAASASAGGSRGSGSSAAPEADMRLRVEALRAFARGGGAAAGYAVDGSLCKRIVAEANQWKREMRAMEAEGPLSGNRSPAAIANGSVDDLYACGLLLAFAYPDRIAQRRSGLRYLLRNGRGAVLTAPQPLMHAAYLVAADLDDQGAESRIYLGAPVELEDIERYFPEQIETEQLIEWDAAARAVRARQRKRFGALIVKELPLPHPSSEDVLEALLRGIQAEGLAILPWTRNARQLQQRLIFMHEQDASWPDASEEALLLSLKDWLGPHVYGMKSRDDLQRLKLVESLESLLPWDKRRELDQCAPTHLGVPSGSRIAIDYSDSSAPVLAVRLQEMFGLKESPRIAQGKVALTLHLLSPAQRPVQVTRDLASFWQNTYFEVKKDLKGRYPKHYWPDDPHIAEPTNRTRPRNSPHTS